MRTLGAFLFAFVSTFPSVVFAQKQHAPLPPAQGAPESYLIRDGGVSETLQSIFIPPKAQAPFELTLQTEWVKTLSDGGTITLVNQRRIARDGKGRIYQERWSLVPRAGKMVSAMTVIQITDPATHILYNCFQDERRQCQKISYSGSTSTQYKEADPQTGNLPGGTGSVVHDELGQQSMEGLQTVGTRSRTIISPGVFGNDREMTIERESWYSEQLGINLLSIRIDPRFGKQTFTATNVILAEPDLKLFELPKGFKVAAPRENPPPDSY